MGLIREKGSYSTTFKKIDGIIQLMCSEIDNNQEIKRLLAYPTKDPLANRALTYDGKMIYQRDISKSMLSDISIDVSKNQDSSNVINLSRCIFDMGWNDEKDIEKKNSIYISHYHSGTNLIDEAVFLITIIVYSDYLRLFETSRAHAIVSKIVDIIDNSKTDKVSSKELGDLRFKLINKITEGKITKGINATCMIIPVGVKLINTKVNSNGYMITR